MADTAAYENFKKQIREMSDENLTEYQTKELWKKLSPNEKIFFYTSANSKHELSSEENEYHSDMYDGLVTTDEKKREFKAGEKVDKDDLIRHIFYLPEHNLGKLRKMDTGYKANSISSKSRLRVKTLEIKKKFADQIKEDDDTMKVYDSPNISYDTVDFKNFLLYTYYGLKPTNQNLFRTARHFYKEYNLTENMFMEECKALFINMLFGQDETISYVDASQIAEALFAECDLDDYVYIYNNKIRPVVV